MEKSHPDFTGYWRLVKTENFDTFLRDVGFAWTVRKAALRFGSSSVDLISHAGSEAKITSLCAKGSWTRMYDTSRTLREPNPQGELCTTTAGWEDSVLVTRMEGSPLGVVVSSRFMAGPCMVVKTSVRLPSGRDAIMFWMFDRMQPVHERVTCGAHDPRHALLRQLASDHQRVARATKHDNRYLQRVLLDWQRWRSPADDFIQVASPSYNATRPSIKTHSVTAAVMRRLSPPRSPLSLSKSPSDASLSALHAAQDAAARAASVHAHRVATNNANITMDASTSIDAASVATDATSRLGTTGGRTSPHPFSAGESALVVENGGVVSPPYAVVSMRASLRLGGRSTSPSSTIGPESVTNGAGPPVGPTTQPLPGTPAPRPSSRASPSPIRAGASPPIQLQLAHKLVEFCEGRGIASVVPLTSPNDTQEPQLLRMSPEQAEETAAKMAELEADMLLARQSHPVGWNCCGFIITRRTSQIPDYLRVWEMTLTNS